MSLPRVARNGSATMTAQPLNPFDPGYCDEHELATLGFRAVGRDVRVARNATLIGLPNIALGDHVRIDGGTVIVAEGAGSLTLGSYIHIGAHCYIAAGAGVVLEDFSGLSQGVRIYSRSDDYSGEHLTNPTVPDRYLGVSAGPVHLQRHVIVGSGSVILPGLTLGEGCSVGALSLVNKDLAPWGMYFGAPARRLRERSRRLLELEAELRRSSPRVATPGPAPG